MPSYVEDYPGDVVDFAYNWSANRVTNPAKEKEAIAYFEETVHAIVGFLYSGGGVLNVGCRQGANRLWKE
jgi:hypothetical protein